MFARHYGNEMQIHSVLKIYFILLIVDLLDLIAESSFCLAQQKGPEKLGHPHKSQLDDLIELKLIYHKTTI